MKRHYFISEDLEDLGAVEHELEDSGITKPQIHVLSINDAAVEQLQLNDVEAVLRKDVVHSMELGALIGVVAAGLVLLVSYLSGLPETVGWVPFAFLAIVALGFCTWEGGMFGIQVPHREFRRFVDALRKGKHVLFVDVDPPQEGVLAGVAARHPALEPAGDGSSTPRWVIEAQNKWQAFIKAMP